MRSGLFLVTVSGALLWLGTKPQKESKEKESMSMKDAKMFPIFGSAALLTLFLALKYLPKDIVNMVFRCIFSMLGIFSVYRMLLWAHNEVFSFVKQYIIKKNVDKKKVKEEISNNSRDSVSSRDKNNSNTTTTEKDKNINTNTTTTIETVQNNTQQAKEDIKVLLKEIIRFPNIIFFSLSIGFNALYIKNKNLLSANILACCFAVTGLQEIKPDSTKTVLLLLSLLFIYDIFWVFCTKVMISVAKDLDLPMKIVYMGAKGKASMIGLGDIVVPGLYLSVAREFAEKKNAPMIWRLGYLGYIIALIVTFLVVYFTKSGQPALLYICPLVIAGSIAGAYLHKRTKEFVDYKNE